MKRIAAHLGDNLESLIHTKYPHIYTVAIQQSDNLLFEYHQEGYRNKLRPVRSVTKSVLSTLYGIALEKDLFKSLDEKVIEYFPEYRAAKLDPGFGEITIRHLLTMTSGLDCSDKSPKGFFRSKDWVRFYIERPIVTSPGSSFSYSSASSHLLSALLYKITSLNVYDFAKANLFYPLGIKKTNWSYDKQGHFHGGFGLDLFPEDLIKLGRLYLDHGVVNGKQLVPAEFIQQASRKQIKGGFPERDSYGYHWWIGSKNNVDFYYAAGLGGQYLFVAPILDLIVAITSDSRKPHIENKRIFTDIILSEVS